MWHTNETQPDCNTDLVGAFQLTSGLWVYELLSYQEGFVLDSKLNRLTIDRFRDKYDYWCYVKDLEIIDDKDGRRVVGPKSTKN